MATVQEIKELAQAYRARMDAFQAQIAAVVKAANASGKPQWTDELQNQRDAIKAAMKPFADRWNRLLRLEEAREYVLHCKFDRIEEPGDWSTDVTYIVGRRGWPHADDVDTANAAFLHKHELAESFAACGGDIHTDTAKYLEARDLVAQTELRSLAGVD